MFICIEACQSTLSYINVVGTIAFIEVPSDIVAEYSDDILYTVLPPPQYVVGMKARIYMIYILLHTVVIVYVCVYLFIHLSTCRECWPVLDAASLTVNSSIPDMC